MFELIMKRFHDFNVYMMPFLILFIYTLLTGTSYAFSIVAYFFVIIGVFLLNVFRVHRKFIEKAVIWASLEIVFIVLLMMWLLNIGRLAPPLIPISFWMELPLSEIETKEVLKENQNDL